MYNNTYIYIYMLFRICSCTMIIMAALFSGINTVNKVRTASKWDVAI